MSDDDDEDCQHRWVLADLDKHPPPAGMTLPRLAVVSECADCGAVSYDAPGSEVRPPLSPPR